LRNLLWSLLSPSQTILGLLVVGAFLLAFGRLRAGRVITVTAGAALVVFGLTPAADYIAHPLETRFPRPELPETITGIVLLSGSEAPAVSEVYGEPQIGAHGDRYTTALRLAARYPNARIVYTGPPAEAPDKGSLGTQTAVAMELLNSLDLEPSRLSFEQASRDTCDNAANTRTLVSPKEGEAWVVITSAMHMPRTVACFGAAGWPVIPYPTDYSSLTDRFDFGSIQMADNLNLLDLALHEWVGLAYYRVAGKTQELYPAPD